MKTFYSVCLVVGLLVACSIAAAQPIVVNIAPASQEVSEGDAVEVELIISGLGEFTAPSLGTFDLDVFFDPAVLAFQRAVFGNQLDVSGLGSIFEVAPGVMNVNVFELSLDDPDELDAFQTGSFTMATLMFTALMPGTSPLDLLVQSLGDAQGDPLNADVQDGEVRVGLSPLPGDIENDGDVDRDDLNLLLADRGKRVADSACESACDLDGDGRITALDARRLTLLCTRSRCAIEPQGPTITVLPAFQSVSLGEVVEVTLMIDGLGKFEPPSLATFDVDITFDSDLLAFQSASFGDQLDILGLGSISEVVPGVMNVSLFEVSLDDAAALDTLQAGRFVLATLRFETIGTGRSPLDPAINALGDTFGDLLTAEVVSGRVFVTTNE